MNTLLPISSPEIDRPENWKTNRGKRAQFILLVCRYTSYCQAIKDKNKRKKNWQWTMFRSFLNIFNFCPLCQILLNLSTLKADGLRWFKMKSIGFDGILIYGFLWNHVEMCWIMWNWVDFMEFHRVLTNLLGICAHRYCNCEYFCAYDLPWFQTPQPKRNGENRINQFAQPSFSLHLLTLGRDEWEWLRPVRKNLRFDVRCSHAGANGAPSA